MMLFDGRFFLILFAAVLSNSLMAQAPAGEKPGLELSVGYSSLARQDLVFSPFIHQAGSPLNIDVAYRVPGKWTKMAAVRWSQYKPLLGSAYVYTNRRGQQVITQSHIFNLIDFRFAMGRKVYEKAGKTLRLGGLFSSDIDVLSLNYGFAGSSGYFGSFGLGLWSEGKYPFKENQSVGFTVQVPLVAWVARSPYLINDDPYMKNNYSHNGLKTFAAYVADGKLQTVNRFRKIDAALQYTYYFKKRVGVGGKYELEVLHHALPLPLQSYQHLFSLTTQINF